VTPIQPRSQRADAGSDGSLSARDAFEALSELLGLMHARLQEAMRRYDLPPPYALALAQIEGAAPMKQLARKLGCDPSFVTAIADILEDRGLARRETGETDRRSKNLVLTRKGIAARSSLQREFFDDLPGIRRLDERERRELVGLLRKMVAAERAGGATPGACGGAAGC
jgi:DNA-binding MarR family transcriptional regulator